jgi:ABC-type glutathione transport system ATPase component
MTEVMRVSERISKKDARTKGVDILSKLHFSDPERVWNSYPHELSGGMCKRVAVAMALSNKATLLLADEPTSALDVTSQAEFIKQLQEIVQNDNLAVLLVTHNMAVAKALADRTGYIRNGKLKEERGNVFAVTAS